MGHRNTQFTGHMTDMETDQQGHSHLHPEPCIFYGNIASFPHPSFHSMVPAPGNQGNFNFHHMPERHDSGLFYGMPQFNGPQHQHPAPNLDLAIAAPSGHYNPYMAPPSGIRDFPVQVNHGTHDQLSLSSSHRVVGIPTDTYTRTIPYMDSIRASFKRKNAEGASGSYQYHNAPAGPSSSVAPVTAMTAESDVNLLDPPSFLPPEYGGNDPTLMVESGSQRSARNRLRMVGHESVMAHNTGQLIQGNFAAPPVQLPGNPWLDMHFGTNNGDIGTFAWAHAPTIQYTHVPDVNGASNRSPGGFLPPPIPQGHPSAHNPPPSMQGVRGYNLPSQVAASAHQISTISSSNTGINHFQDLVDAGSSFVAPVPPLSFRSYRPHRREIMLDSSARHQALPHMRVLPEDEVAILGIPGYHEAGDTIDQHRDMRLDIDHMSYEELLALGEQIGSVGTGLSEEFVRNHLKLRTFSCSTTCINLEEEASLDHQINFCVVCQTDYEDGEEIGTVDCGHEYHSECIKKWLHTKNTCPVCKSTALNRKARGL
ncbi:hypothetical protein C2S53_003192 [Perilla frutescens var. hirtella]|uniref:RING-type E3 ubiquitin transferase n=1 Tax=Perilla frutescens var. hirtella TaxID=608512 RepID=A0AAD4JKE7_PERFH|nr:hypothetical protein C2S53_003192 [Perilla frutescens var. hirtella]